MVVAWKRSSSLVQGRPAGDLWLRVVGTSRADQVVRLSAPKCTIGSASGCTLRLRAVGVRPIECLILRGAHGTVVRACVAGTRLNGECFRDARLTTGDRLKFGPIELEVLAGDGDDGGDRGNDGDGAAEPPLAERSANVTQVMDSRSHRPLKPFDPATAQRQRDQARQARRRAHKLVEQLRKLRGESTWLREQIELAAGSVAAARESEQARLQSEHELARLRQELEAERAVERDGRQEAEEELRLAQQMLDQQREAWQARTASHDAELSARQLRHQDELAARHEATLGEIERERADWTNEHQQWTLWKQEEEQRLADLQATLDAERAAVRQDQERLEAVGQDLANDRENSTAEAAEIRRQIEADRAALANDQDRLAALRVACDDRKTDLDLREQSLAERLVMVEGTLAEKQSFDAQLHQRSEELDRRAFELTQRSNETEHRAAELAARQTEFLAGRSDFETRFREVEQRQAELAERESRVAERERDLADRQTQSEQQEAGLAERRTQLENREVELAEFNATLLKRAGELDDRQSRLDEHANTLAGEAHSRLSDLEGCLQSQQADLETRAAAIARDEQLWQEERARHETEREQRKSQLDEQATELGNREQALAAERVELDRLHGERESQLADRAGLLDRTAQELDLLKQQLETEQVGHRERHDQVLAAVERQSVDLAVREQSLTELEQTLATREQSLTDREQQLAAAAESISATTAEATAETVAPVDPRIVEELEQRERELSALQSELDRQRDELIAERREGAERVTCQLAELAELRQDLLRERDALREAHGDDAIPSEVEPLAAELAELSDDVEVEETVADRDQEEQEEKPRAVDLLERCRRELEVAAAEEEPAECDDEIEACDQAQVDDETCEVVEEVEEVEEEFVEAPVESKRGARSAAPAEGVEEDSVEAYFAAMLNRVRGGAPAPAPAPAAPKRNKRKSDRTAATAAPSVDPAAQTVEIPLMASVVDIGPTPTELTRRGSADVKDFSAMRELANAQVKQALDVHGRKRLARTVLGMSSAAVLCLLVTVVVLNFVSHDQAALRTLSYAGFVGAVFWAFSASAAVKQLIAARRAANDGMRKNLDRSQRQGK